MKKIILAISIIALFALACNKAENIEQNKSTNLKKTRTNPVQITEIPECKVSISDGMLIFDSEIDVDRYYQYLSTKTIDEIFQFEVRNGFKSYTREVDLILKAYELLNENVNTQLSDIHNFWNSNSQYIEFTDEDYNEKIIGLHNSIINKDGLVQIGKLVLKHVGNIIYATNDINIDLLINNNYSSNLVTQSVTKSYEMKKTRSVSVWHDASFEKTVDCTRKRKTTSSLSFYGQGPSMPAYYQVGNIIVSSGFTYKLKNLKRGWTGVWYGEARPSNFTGYYHRAYSPFTTFDNPDNISNVSRVYNLKTWTKPWDNDAAGAIIWGNSQINTSWAYVAGTVTYDVCGENTHTY
jgi:hypothetical protein